MKTIKILLLSIFVTAGLASCNSDDDSNVQTFSANLSQLNNSGASGTVNVSVNGNIMTVNVQATGMVANQAHPQHIHGKDDGTNATCPPPSADTNSDGTITIPEGAPFYGAVILPLENFPTADANGTVTYSQTFTLGEGETPTAETLSALENRAIVLHGLNDGSGTYVATTPVACGELVRN